jgi:DNA-binding CsgD family transcriptional regulator/predicted membrane channel-forming protein YqfA (hemolysin III family)
LYLITPEVLGLNNLKTQLLLHLSGYFVATTYFMYVVKEYEILDVVTNSRNLIHVLIIALLASSLTTFFILGKFELAKNTLITLPILMSIATCIFIHKQIIKASEITQHRFVLYTSYFGIVLMTSIPLLVSLKSCSEINITMINLPFALLALGYYYQLSKEKKQEFEALTNIGYFSNQVDLEAYGLTKRELEIAKLILENKSFKEIGDECSISTYTATKHASNLYQKVGCKSKEELIKKFGSKHNKL